MLVEIANRSQPSDLPPVLSSVDCDRIAHRAYEPGTPTYRRIVEAFGPSIVRSAGEHTLAALSLHGTLPVRMTYC